MSQRTSQSDPFVIADRNTTLVSQLYLFRLLELLNIRQCAFRQTDSGYEFYETTGSMFPAIDDVYSRSIHDLNGVLATISMQSQMIAHEFFEGEKVNIRAQKIYDLLEQAEIYMNRSESMTRIFNGKIDSLELGDMVDLASATGCRGSTSTARDPCRGDPLGRRRGRVHEPGSDHGRSSSHQRS